MVFTWDIASSTKIFQWFIFMCWTEDQSKIISIGIEFFDIDHLKETREIFFALYLIVISRQLDEN